MDDELIKTINEQYQVGNSIQAIARTHRLEVTEVIQALRLNELLEVDSVGDLIDAKELKAGEELVPYTKHRAKYTTN